ncbi:sialate O-acetylesterase [Planctomycetota bacterium]
MRKWQPGAEDDKTQTHPYDDMLERLHLARKNGTVKGILWHQGESDGKMGINGTYAQALAALITRVRTECADPNVPIIIGQLGQFPERPWSEGRIKVDQAHRQVAEQIGNAAFASSKGLKDRGDQTHFDAASARLLGKRFAEKMIELQQQ